MNSDTYLRIISSSDIALSYLYSYYNQGITPTQVSGQPTNQMLLSNIVRIKATSTPTLLSLGNFALTNPPYSTETATLTFRTEQLISSTYYLIDESTIEVISVPS